MKALISGLMLALVVQFSFAQKAPVKFGDIPMDDMKMTAYDLDPSASAVILVDYGEAALNINPSNVTMNFERHVRIKILKKEGLSWADVAIPLFHSGSTEEKVSSLKAVTYSLENDKIVATKMSKEGIFKEKFNRNINLQKFTMPNVKEGSVIEYSYTVISEFFTNFPDWQFQRTIPTRLSEYWAVIPDFFIYEKYMQGYIAPTSYEVKPRPMSGGYQAKLHHWISKDVPSFKEEPYMTSENDYVSKINFALSHINFPNQPVQEIMGSWDKLSKNLMESEGFGGVIRGSGFLKKHVEEVTAGITDPEAKVKAIYNFVKKNLEWDGTKDFSVDNLKKVFELKKGTSGDINLALGSMLEKANIPVNMILLSTRDHGFIRQQYPMTEQFNYVICAALLPNKILYLDATEKFLPIDILPDRCLNGQGLIISKTNFGWVNLDTKGKSKTIVDADLSLNNEGLLKGKLNFIRDGYDAHKMRKEYFLKGEETYAKDFSKGASWNVEKSLFENTSEIDQPAKESHDLIINEHVVVSGGIMYLNPFVTAKIGENPFKLETREYPVDFGNPLEKMYLCKIAIPEGYSVDELPQSKVLLLPGNAAKYVYNVGITGNMINILSTLQINKSLFIQTEYQNLREFYNQVIAKQSEQIVLKKK